MSSSNLRRTLCYVNRACPPRECVQKVLCALHNDLLDLICMGDALVDKLRPVLQWLAS